MKRIICSLAVLSVLLVGSKPVNAADTPIVERVKGHILLQVQSHGEAWYVSPVDGARYYMKDGPTAYEMMRYFGLGMTEADFAKLQAGDKELIGRLLGRIVLRVQAHGEAYYIHPDGTIHYLQNGEAAYQVMRNLSLGITNADLELVEEKEMPAEVRERLPVTDPISSPTDTAVPAPPTSGLSQEDVERLAQELAQRLLEEQQEAVRKAEEAKVYAPIPLWMRMNGSLGEVLLAMDQEASGASSAENLTRASRESDWISKNHIYDVQPRVYSPNADLSWLNDSYYHIDLSVYLGSEESNTDISCSRFGADFWQGVLEPHDHTVRLKLSEVMKHFISQANSPDHRDNDYSESHTIGVRCYYKDNPEQIFSDKLYLRLTTDYINY